MTDGNKIAAAILAVEAAKQMLELNPLIAKQPNFNVATNLTNCYRSMLAAISQQGA
jgi:hypothetical protein